MIAAGIVAALLMNSFLFPRRCRVRNQSPLSTNPRLSLHTGHVHKQCLPNPRVVESIVHGIKLVYQRPFISCFTLYLSFHK